MMVKKLFGLEGIIENLPGYTDHNFLLDCGSAGKYVVKIGDQNESYELLNQQIDALKHLNNHLSLINVPKVIRGQDDQYLYRIDAENGEKYWLRLLSYLDGNHLSAQPHLHREILMELGSALGEMDNILDDFKDPAVARDLPWDLRQIEWMGGKTNFIKNLQNQRMVDYFLLQYNAQMPPILTKLPRSLIHNDVNGENLLVSTTDNKNLTITGIIDFGDLVYTYTAAELAIACAYLNLDDSDPLDNINAVIGGYNNLRPLQEIEIEALFPLIYLRKCMSVTMSAVSEIEDPHNKHTQVSVKHMWASLKQLQSIDWLSAENQFRNTCGFESRQKNSIEAKSETAAHVLEQRQKYIGPSLKTAYAEPLTIIEGRGQYLIDNSGRAYLDCVNNVCHVGHSHPRVTQALEKQAGILNTNTRYLHPLLGEYAKRLTDTLPDSLEVCFFVNSGSEANELALRMAQVHTGREDIIVLGDAYHGNTGRLIEMSPY